MITGYVGLASNGEVLNKCWMESLEFVRCGGKILFRLNTEIQSIWKCVICKQTYLDDKIKYLIIKGIEL